MGVGCSLLVDKVHFFCKTLIAVRLVSKITDQNETVKVYTMLQVT